VKKSLNHSNIITKYWIVNVLLYYNNFNMLFVSNGFNILKVNESIHVHMLIIEEMWKISLIHYNINVGFKIATYVLINYKKCKMKLLNNGFNMLEVNGSIHVPCW
jgi:hypothetical protein